MAAPSRSEALSLYRSLLRAARSFSDYNIREYTKRRAADAFRDNRALSSDPSAVEDALSSDPSAAAFFDGKTQLEIACRQATVYRLYSPKIKSVMDSD